MNRQNYLCKQIGQKEQFNYAILLVNYLRTIYPILDKKRYYKGTITTLEALYRIIQGPNLYVQDVIMKAEIFAVMDGLFKAQVY